MLSPECERAIDEAVQNGNALLKFISRNDAGVTGSHQAGFYLPKAAWPMFSPHPPTKGQNAEEPVGIVWQDGRETDSRVKWYGVGTRSEYRLTRFGNDFPFLNLNTVGNLLVLIPFDHHNFHAYVLDLDDDIEEIQAALGVEPFEHWGVYESGAPKVESEGDCIDRLIRVFADDLTDFPEGDVFSAKAIEILEACRNNFKHLLLDDALMSAMEAEYRVFRYVERRLCEKDVLRTFADIDDFLKVASPIMNRRKARAGRSLENHVHQFLLKSNIPHEMRSKQIPGKPDVVIPSVAAYLDPSYPVEKLFIVGVKTTCKDRWRQILNEGRRVPTKHLITTQPGISAPQLEEMKEAKVTLVVPKRLHAQYPKNAPMTIETLDSFAKTVLTTL